MTEPERSSSPEPVGILIVDDRRENRAALRAVLDAAEYRIVEADSGRAALKALLNDEFAALLVDVVMPEMSGLELATLVRQRERSASLPILFLTAQATELDAIYRAYATGAVDYLVKPLIPEMVRAKVAVFAELYRQRKHIEQQARKLLEAERREADLRMAELRLATERRYRNLAEAVPHVVWTAKPDGTIDYVNRRFYELTGLPSTTESLRWDAIIDRQDQPRCMAAWQSALRSGDMLELECRLQCASGEFRWHLCRAVPERSPDGEIIGWIGTFTDIDEQKRIASVLAEFRGTLDAVLDAVMIFDPNGLGIQYVNQGAAALLECPPSELVGRPAQEVLGDIGEESLRELLAGLRGDQPVCTLETGFRGASGRVVPVELSIQFVAIDGGRCVSIARDIEDRKRAAAERELLYRQALEAVRVRDEFLSIASHELKTPLTSLQLQVEDLLHSPRSRGTSLDERIERRLTVASRQVRRLGRLVEELLEVSRIETGHLRVQRERIDLSEVVSDVVARFEETAAHAGCTLTMRANGAVEGDWDRLRIEQVITNLLANAVKFGAGKPIEIAATLEDGMARLVVVDHGIGIDPKDTERIFDRFERAVSSRSYGGLGLGLYIVKQIVDAHGGRAEVTSRPGDGARFSIELPVHASPGPESSPG